MINKNGLFAQINVLEKLKSRKNYVVKGEYKGQVVICKEFKNMDLLENECRILQIMAHTDLVPNQLVREGNQLINSYIEGELFEDLFKNSAYFSNTEMLQKLAISLAQFLQVFHPASSCIINDVNFRNFIVSENRCYCIDFEHAAPGHPNVDIAGVCAHALRQTSRNPELAAPFIIAFLDAFHTKAFDIANDLRDYMKNHLNEFYDQDILLNTFLAFDDRNIEEYRDFGKL